MNNTKFRLFGIGLLLLMYFSLGMNNVCSNAIPVRPPNWSTLDEVVDLAISANGSLVVAAVHVEVIDRQDFIYGASTRGELRVYDGTGNLLWNWSQQYALNENGHMFDVTVYVYAVDISDGGNAVVAAITNITDIYIWNESEEEWEYQATDYHNCLLFWKNAKSLSGENPPYDWRSKDLAGIIGPEALAISGSGNEVVIVGTGDHVYYWNSTLSLSGFDVECTWQDVLNEDLSYVDISDDGDIVATLGEDNDVYSAFVYKGCKSRDGDANVETFDLSFEFGTSYKCGGLALSDNGQYLVAGVGNKIYFFNTSTSEPWAPQWTCLNPTNEWAAAVDISGNGNTAAAVTNEQLGSPSSLMIFQNAASKVGEVTPDREFTEANIYTKRDYVDLSMDGLGRFAVGGTGDYVFVVETSTGGPLWLYNGDYPHVSWFVKVAEEGRAVATAGDSIRSLYYFRLVEAAPPVGGIITSAAWSQTALNNMALTIVAILSASTIILIAAKTKLRK